MGHISKTWTTLYGHQLDGDEIVNVPVYCYIVNWRNRKVAMTGLVQLSNLISSYNGSKSSYNGKTPTKYSKVHAIHQAIV